LNEVPISLEPGSVPRAASVAHPDAGQALVDYAAAGNALGVFRCIAWGAETAFVSAKHGGTAVTVAVSVCPT